jgi:formate hydrogenlyase transcriptional activator
MIGQSEGFRRVLRDVQVVAPTDAAVLIQGETGTGKELVARAVHERSSRSRGPFIKVNCAAIPAGLLESELFGHEKGAFTGAIAQKLGRFEMAHQGTLFLDEIGEIPLELQPKLLRALQEQEFERLGGNRTIQVDVRIIAATNRDLSAMVEENKFRADLYYRLAVFPLNIPPLRERRDDIPVLTRYFVHKYSRRMGRAIEIIPTQSIEALIGYDWPGNIRELQNVIERSVIMSKGPEFQVLLPQFTPQSNSIPAAAAPLYVRPSNVSQAVERSCILDALKEANGHVGGASGAAARLGLKRTTLQSRMRKYNIGRLYQ